jgi:hypothetical protein
VGTLRHATMLLGRAPCHTSFRIAPTGLLAASADIVPLPRRQ